jgi:uncharacterized membrane protein
MAQKKKRQLSRREHRRLRTQQIIIAVFTILVIASFLASLISSY